jgi:hypothetical protein
MPQISGHYRTSTKVPLYRLITGPPQNRDLPSQSAYDNWKSRRKPGPRKKLRQRYDDFEIEAIYLHIEYSTFIRELLNASIQSALFRSCSDRPE